MSLVVSDSLTELSNASSSNVCVIKNVVHSSTCDELVRELLAWRDGKPQNEDRGANWWYQVAKGDSQFSSFLFYRLPELEPVSLRDKLLSVYRKLFDAHVLCGTLPADAIFEDYLEDRGEQPSFEPLVFFYDVGAGKFERHAHSPGYQNTQVLINLTKRNRDYAGGETIIEEPEGNIVELGEVFDQGDMFSFPYALYHRVNRVEPANHASGLGRMSILMPFNARGKANIRY